MDLQEEEGRNTLTRKAQERMNCTNKREREADKDGRHQKKRRKLKHTVIDDEWGLKSGDQDVIERSDIAKVRFLHSKPGPCTLRTGKHQTTLRVWTAHELLAGDIVISCPKQVTDEVRWNWE